MPTYLNTNDYSINIDGTTILPGASYTSPKVILDSGMEEVSELPYPTTLSLETILSNSDFYKKPSLPFLMQTALGLVPGVSTYKKFGYATIGTSTTTVWDKGGKYVYLDSPSEIKIASSSINDTLGGTGANKARIEGIRETESGDWEFFSKEVSLTGREPTTIISDAIRVFRISVTLSGSTGGAVGTIAVSDGTFVDGVPTGKTLAQVLNGNNQTLMAMMTIPSGYTGLIIDYFSNSGKSAELDLDSVVRKYGTNTFNIVRRIMLYERTFTFPNDIPFIIPEKADIEVRGKAVATSAPCAAGFDMLLIRNS